MTFKTLYLQAVVFSSFLFWLPLAMQLAGGISHVKTITRVHTVQPAQCGGSRGFNIFPLGGFGGGPDTILPYDPGFLIAPYTFDTIGPPAPGSYTVANQTGHWGGEALNWLNTGDIDPNSPEGYALILRADTTTGVFMEYTIGVCPNTTYHFEFNILNLYDTLQPPAAGCRTDSEC